MTTAYPLAWPIGFPRTKVRQPSKFKTSVSQAVQNVTTELRRFGNDTGRGVQNLIISSNVTLTNQRPIDPGIACYFVWDNVQVCIAVDRYNKCEENLQAVALIIDAERTKMRHGGLNIVRAAFRGYASLPPPVDAFGALLPLRKRASEIDREAADQLTRLRNERNKALEEAAEIADAKAERSARAHKELLRQKLTDPLGVGDAPVCREIAVSIRSLMTSLDEKARLI